MKKGDLRRTQILDAAERLFLEKGYEGASVQDVLDALGMSKGGFYHYFDAKESLLRAVCERRLSARMERVLSELKDSRRRPADRLNLLLRQASLFETEDARFAGLMLKLCYVDRDPAMLAQRRRVLMERLLPAVGDVLAAGTADGSFFVRRPEETGRILLLLAFDADEEVCAMLAADPENLDALIPAIDLLNAWREAVEILSGAPHGSLELFDIGKLVACCREAQGAIVE